MVKNYLKLGFRNLVKNRLSSFINITGLGMAIGCCMVVFVFLDLWFNLDKFHTKLDLIYVIERIAENQNGKQELLSESPVPMGNLMKEKFPQIKNSVRMNYVNVYIKQGDNVIKDQITFTDDAFYTLFDFPLKWGDKNSLVNQNGIVLSEEFSKKIYRTENPVGKTLELIFTKDGIDLKEGFIVTGVMNDTKLNASFRFNALLPFSKMVSLGLTKQDDWTNFTDITFLELESNKAILPTTLQCKELLDIHNAANKDSKIKAFNFQPLKGMQFHSYKLNYSQFANTHIIGIVMLIAIAAGILLLAFFNYMNIAVASASGRLKEIGVRKVLGSERKQIIIQFLIENLLICLAGMILGLILTRILFLPWFSRLVVNDLSSGLFTNSHVWIALVILTILSVLGGAAYPAVYISALKPVVIVKGKLGLGNKNGFRKFLLGFQFCITFLGVSMALAFVRENRISRAKPWGYDPTENVVIRLDGSNKYELLKSELIKNNRVKGITGSVERLGRYGKQIVLKINGQDQAVTSFQSLGGLATHFGIKILNGRDLNKDFETDITSSIIVNQAFLKANHWTTALGKSIEYDGRNYSIVGETNDFRYESFEHKVEPLVMMACKPEQVNFAYVKVASGSGTGSHTLVEGVWKKLFPDKPYDYYYQDNVFDNYYYGFSQVIQILSAASFIMVLVSICGIFGLALLILSRKMKDLSIRKVLGAGFRIISIQIFKEFTWSILIAFIIGVPLSWMFTQAIFSQFSPESTVSIIPFITALITVMMMTLMSVVWHLYKANTFNPIKSLRSE